MQNIPEIDNKIIEEHGLSLDEYEKILKILDLSPVDIIRTSEKDYRDNNIEHIKSDEELIDAILRYPKILQRPIILNGDRGVIGRPPENILSII